MERYATRYLNQDVELILCQCIGKAVVFRRKLVLRGQSGVAFALRLPQGKYDHTALSRSLAFSSKPLPTGSYERIRICAALRPLFRLT
jgi:hypothetical protein